MGGGLVRNLGYFPVPMLLGLAALAGGGLVAHPRISSA